MMMKKLLGLGFILVALAVVTMGMVGFPKLDVNIWRLFPVLLFAFFTLENLLKKSQEDTLRVLRDKTELFVDGQNIIALGQNKFTVNTQQLALTLLNRNNELFYHLTGTSFYQKVKNEEIYRYQDIWNQEFVSENQLVYRAEYLAYQAFLARNEKDFDVINYNMTLTFTVNGEERYIEMKTPFNVDDNE